MSEEITPTLEEGTEVEEQLVEERKSSIKFWVTLLIVLIVIGLIATGIVLLSGAGNETTAKVRDIFIIVMAFESIIIGVALVVLVIQISKLINLLQNEVKPILQSTKETVDTLKGTSQFLSENLVEPVIKLNGYLAGMKHLLDIFKLTKK